MLCLCCLSSSLCRRLGPICRIYGSPTVLFGYSAFLYCPKVCNANKKTNIKVVFVKLKEKIQSYNVTVFRRQVAHVVTFLRCDDDFFYSFL